MGSGLGGEGAYSFQKAQAKVQLAQVLLKAGAFFGDALIDDTFGVSFVAQVEVVEGWQWAEHRVQSQLRHTILELVLGTVIFYLYGTNGDLDFVDVYIGK